MLYQDFHFLASVPSFPCFMSNKFIKHIVFFKIWALGWDQFKGVWNLSAVSPLQQEAMFTLFIFPKKKKKKKKKKLNTSVLFSYLCKIFAEHNIKSVFQGISLPKMLENKSAWMVFHNASRVLNLKPNGSINLYFCTFAV